MGTRGYFAFRYKGLYYVVYNHWDSYFKGLGYALIRSIKELTKEQWDEIKSTLALYRRNDRSKKGEDIFHGDMQTQNVILTTLESYTGATVTRREPKLDLFIEYVYILDLDNDIFTAITSHHEEEEEEEEEENDRHEPEEFIAYRHSCRFENLSNEWLDSCDST